MESIQIVFKIILLKKFLKGSEFKGCQKLRIKELPNWRIYNYLEITEL